MSGRLLLPLILGMFHGIYDGDEGKISIPSHKVEQKKQHIELSKQKIKRKKGKKNRMNRGKNRSKPRNLT